MVLLYHLSSSILCVELKTIGFPEESIRVDELIQRVNNNDFFVVVECIENAVH